MGRVMGSVSQVEGTAKPGSEVGGPLPCQENQRSPGGLGRMVRLERWTESQTTECLGSVEVLL